MSEEVVGGEWIALPLRCQLSHAQLTDPARCEDCSHLACCNYDELCEAGIGRESCCPIVGCRAVLRRRLLVRDTALRDRLTSVPANIQKVWLRGDELRMVIPEELVQAPRHRPQASGAWLYEFAPLKGLRRSRQSVNGHQRTVDGLCCIAP